MRAVKPIVFLLTAWLLCGGCAHHHHEDEGGLTLDALPTAVRDHFNRDHAGVRVRSIDYELVGGDTHYQIRYEDQGLLQEVDYDSAGDEIKPDAKLP